MEYTNLEFYNGLLEPIIKSIVKGISYEWILMNSNLYIMADDCILYIINLETKVDNNICLSSKEKNNIFGKAYNIIAQAHINNIIYDNPELDKDPKFMELATAKSSAGAGFYYIDTALYTTFIPVFNGLPYLTKGDKVGVKLYEIEKNKILVNMTVFKKKLCCSYDLYYYIINVNRPIR